MTETFGKYLKKLRRKNKLTLIEVEKITGISNGYLSQVETGKRNMPKLRMLNDLAKLYKVKTNEIVDKAISIINFNEKKRSKKL